MAVRSTGVGGPGRGPGAPRLCLVGRAVRRRGRSGASRGADRCARPLPSVLLPPPSLPPGARASVCGAAARKCRRCAAHHPGRRQRAGPPARPPRSRPGREQAPREGPGRRPHWPPRVPAPAAPRPSTPCSWLLRPAWRCWSPTPGSPRFAAAETREGLWLPGSLAALHPRPDRGPGRFLCWLRRPPPPRAPARRLRLLRSPPGCRSFRFSGYRGCVLPTRYCPGFPGREGNWPVIA